MTSQNQIYIMLAIERARDAGFVHFAAALVEMLRAELREGRAP